MEIVDALEHYKSPTVDPMGLELGSYTTFV